MAGFFAAGITLVALAGQQLMHAQRSDAAVGMQIHREPRFAATWVRLANTSEWHGKLLEANEPHGCLNVGLSRLFWCARVVLELFECAVAGHGGAKLQLSDCGANIRAAVERRAASLAAVHLQRHINDKKVASASEVRVVSHAVHEACTQGREHLFTLPVAKGSAEQRKTVLRYARELRAYDSRTRQALVNEWAEAFSSFVVRHEAWPETTHGAGLRKSGMPELGEAALVSFLEDCLAQPWRLAA